MPYEKRNKHVICHCLSRSDLNNCAYQLTVEFYIDLSKAFIDIQNLFGSFDQRSECRRTELPGYIPHLSYLFPYCCEAAAFVSTYLIGFTGRVLLRQAEGSMCSLCSQGQPCLFQT